MGSAVGGTVSKVLDNAASTVGPLSGEDAVNDGWVNAGMSRPSGLLVAPMNLTMGPQHSCTTNFVTSPALCKSKMVSVRGATTTNQASTARHWSCSRIRCGSGSPRTLLSIGCVPAFLRHVFHLSIPMTAGRTVATIELLRCDFRGLSAALSPDHDDDNGRDPWRNAACDQLRRRWRNSQTVGHLDHGRHNCQPVADALHYARSLSSYGSPRPVVPAPTAAACSQVCLELHQQIKPR
jgi:hypothetical protein